MKRSTHYTLITLAFVLASICNLTAQQPIGTSGDVTKNFVRATYYQKPFTTLPGSFTTDDVIRDLTYLDGFGRPIQQIGIKASAGFKDLVIPFTYDAYGRADKSYLPYATSTGAGGAFKTGAVAAQASYYNAPPTGVIQIPVASGITPSFAQTVMERSPSSRVTQQGFEGAVWQPAASRTTTSGRTMIAEQALNNTTAYATTASTRRVARYEVTLDTWGAPTLVLAGTYAAGALHVEITKNENWTSADGRNGTTEQYMDKQGRVLLSRTFNLKGSTQEMLSTYYIYDTYGNLTYMLPPELNPDRDGTTAPTTTELNNFATQYIYDEYNRMVLRRLPGKGWENTIYNPMDWVIFHQDARQETETIPGFTPGQYHTFHKYDAQGRLVIKGIERNRVWDRISIQNAIKTQTHQWEERKTGTGTIEGYTNQAIPTNAVDMEVQEVYYYDSYANIPGLPDDQSASHSKLVHGKLVASKVRVLGTASFLWTVYYYNDKGELVNKYEQHYQAAKANAFNYDRYLQTYYFNGLPNATTRDHYLSNTGNTGAIHQVKIQNTFTFDHRNREIFNYNSINSATPTILSGKSYNEIGQLISMNLHSTTTTSWGQQVDYRYNARGWLTSITSPLFTQQLKYNDGATPQYNGNIADQVFTRKNTASTPVNVTDTYNYTYDHLSRMLQGQMAGGKGRETLVYDKGGNITSLTRTNAAASVVDQMTYTYASGRLSSIADANASTDAHFQLPGTTTYTYDINGNMKSRVNTASTANNLSSITYNQLNLPQTIVYPTGTASYIYDAYGRKLRSVAGVEASFVTREYINGIEYINGVLSTIDHAQGRIVKTGTVYSYDYTIRDHLGNNRSGFAQGISVTIPNFTADYYPFGLRYLQYERPGVPTNHYLYNGNEWQGAIKQYDFNARFYDPVIARFAQVDPLADMFGQQSVSSYVAFWNSPVTFQDKWGLVPEDGEPSLWKRARNWVRSVIGVKNDKRSETKNKGGLPESFDDDFIDFLNKYYDYNNISAHYILDPVKVYGQKPRTGGETQGAFNASIPFAATAVAVDGPIPIGDIVGAGVLAVAATYDLTQRKYITYTLTNSKGQIYVGRASGFGNPHSIMMNRFSGHHMRAFGYGNPQLDRLAQGYPFGYYAIRGREQDIVDAYGGIGSPELGNAINPIWQFNPNRPLYKGTSNLMFGPYVK